jgi:hypothetical protein
MLANSASRASSNRNEIYGLGERDMRFEDDNSMHTYEYLNFHLNAISIYEAISSCTVTKCIIRISTTRDCERDIASSNNHEALSKGQSVNVLQYH